jgi:hypothetical protein
MAKTGRATAARTTGVEDKPPASIRADESRSNVKAKACKSSQRFLTGTSSPNANIAE